MNKTLKNNVIQWSKDRGIVPNGKPLTQFAKLMSEFSEIFEALRLNSEEKLIDAIGDVQVVLINLSELLKLQTKKDVEFIKIDSINSINELAEKICNIGDMIIKNDYNEAQNLISESYKLLNGFSNSKNIDSDYALKIAYNEIKDRKGFLTPEGNFVKSTDPRYEEILKKYKK